MAFWLALALAAIVVIFTSCAEPKPLSPSGTFRLPEPLRPPAEQPADTQGPPPAAKTTPRTGYTATPKPPMGATTTAGPATGLDFKFTGPAASLNIDNLPLPAFINEIYGNILKVSFEIVPPLRDKKDLVTLRSEEALAPVQIEALARQVLANYGVGVERQGDLLRFVPAKGPSAMGPPLMISGRTMPDVPASHRPIFQIVPLTVVRNVQVAGMLRQAFKGQELDIQEDADRNAIILMGPPTVVNQALQATRLLDQPYMRGRHSQRIEPAYLSAEELAKQLVEVLNAEGYSAAAKPGMGSIIVLPVKAVNAVMVFAGDAPTLEHARRWADNLDRPNKGTFAEERGIYYYPVRNTVAKDLFNVLNAIMTGMNAPPPSAVGQQAQVTTGQPAASPPTPTIAGGRGRHGPASASAAGNTLVVDENRNALIFQGESATWQKLLSVIREMDQPARMVLIEVTVAEITLDDETKYGVEWLLKDVGMFNLAGRLGTSGAVGGLGAAAQGLAYTLTSAGQTRALLYAFASKDRINILSTPRIMVKSGEDASVDVGTEVPTITSQATMPGVQQLGSTSILQQVTYRKTGVLLKVKPVIHSGNRIDLTITQEVSESQPASAGQVNSPSIFTRKIDTSLGLRDGGSVLLGGLISTTTKKGYTGVPFLSEIPIIGNLFKVQGEKESRTELIMLIIPYIIENNQEAEGITEALKSRLTGIELPDGSLDKPGPPEKPDSGARKDYPVKGRLTGTESSGNPNEKTGPRTGKPTAASTVLAPSGVVEENLRSSPNN